MRRSEEDEEQVIKLLEAGMSAPIRLKITTDPDECRLVALRFSESMFASAAATAADSFWKFAERSAPLTGFSHGVANGFSIPKLMAELKRYGLTFKGKPPGDAVVKALKSLTPFVSDRACCTAFGLLEACCPELRDPTLLMRIAQLCSARCPDKTEAAHEAMVFIFDCLRVGRLTGERARDDPYTVDYVSSQEKKKPAFVHELFKKQDAVEFVLHEAAMVQRDLADSVKMYRTPLTIMKHFSAPGEGGLVDKFRQGEKPLPTSSSRARFLSRWRTTAIRNLTMPKSKH